MTGVTLTGVRKVYLGKVEAVRGVSFEVPDGSLCVLVGPSGCGKSTLLRMIAGIETITSGEIRIGGKVVNNLEPADRDIAMVFQNYALYPHMSVYDNMAYGLRNRRVPKPEIERLVRDAARVLEISDYLDRKPRELSGGQRQRVAMGRAIVRQPKAFLFDEPLSNLDAKLRVTMRVEIKKLQRRFATTSIYVTHDQLEAMTLADMLVVMNGGCVEQIGPPLEVYERPATTFVASFIGAPPMNIIRPSANLRADLGHTTAPPDSLVGLRPEDMTLARGPQDITGEHFALPLTVEAAERIGPESYVYGKLGRSPENVIVRVPGHDVPMPGAQVMAVALRSKLHLFGADGRRI